MKNCKTNYLKIYKLLKNKSQKHEFLSIKESGNDYETINEPLQSSRQVLEKTNLLLTKDKKKMIKDIKLLSKNKSHIIDMVDNKYL